MRPSLCLIILQIMNKIEDLTCSRSSVKKSYDLKKKTQTLNGSFLVLCTFT